MRTRPAWVMVGFTGARNGLATNAVVDNRLVSRGKPGEQESFNVVDIATRLGNAVSKEEDPGVPPPGELRLVYGERWGQAAQEEQAGGNRECTGDRVKSKLTEQHGSSEWQFHRKA